VIYLSCCRHLPAEGGPTESGFWLIRARRPACGVSRGARRPGVSVAAVNPSLGRCGRSRADFPRAGFAWPRGSIRTGKAVQPGLASPRVLVHRRSGTLTANQAAAWETPKPSRMFRLFPGAGAWSPTDWGSQPRGWSAGRLSRPGLRATARPHRPGVSSRSSGVQPSQTKPSPNVGILVADYGHCSATASSRLWPTT